MSGSLMPRESLMLTRALQEVEMLKRDNTLLSMKVKTLKDQAVADKDELNRIHHELQSARFALGRLVDGERLM